ncbi:hypothetical protein B0H66DRAFT_111480 [Apodospora peruviana]|uniref:Uncharacterized protein n=1 Tax=Apodospora peruviana TaxID=516989 RepID=A0AAE0IHF5_9PEZI|nr:hypothetical protein B0H66DRAFT_111480 [Apodospora peruviana]
MDEWRNNGSSRREVLISRRKLLVLVLRSGSSSPVPSRHVTLTQITHHPTYVNTHFRLQASCCTLAREKGTRGYFVISLADIFFVFFSLGVEWIDDGYMWSYWLLSRCFWRTMGGRKRDASDRGIDDTNKVPCYTSQNIYNFPLVSSGIWTRFDLSARRELTVFP